ncbi:cupin domain-containing protein [Deinococcus malanensis]|uniref:cupin domain-containing protein n=1 Tax=Deinococcus malanensis TaxID=1706855 RepID=UPI00166F20E7|nr:cupin domain-containing protein [Deinococcus malanensis]
MTTMTASTPGSAPAGSAVSQPATPLRPLVRHNLRVDALSVSGDFDVIQQIVDVAPGASSPMHMHGGVELTTVLEGEVTLRREKDSSVKTYKAGEMYMVNAGEFIQVSNTSQSKASFVVTFLLPKGATLTTNK